MHDNFILQQRTYRDREHFRNGVRLSTDLSVCGPQGGDPVLPLALGPSGSKEDSRPGHLRGPPGEAEHTNVSGVRRRIGAQYLRCSRMPSAARWRRRYYPALPLRTTFARLVAEL